MCDTCTVHDHRLDLCAALAAVLPDKRAINLPFPSLVVVQIGGRWYLAPTSR